jgi:hypothetical protein
MGSHSLHGRVVWIGTDFWSVSVARDCRAKLNDSPQKRERRSGESKCFLVSARAFGLASVTGLLFITREDVCVCVWMCSLRLAADKVREARNAMSHRCDEIVMANFPINGREEEEEANAAEERKRVCREMKSKRQ